MSKSPSTARQAHETTVLDGAVKACEANKLGLNGRSLDALYKAVLIPEAVRLGVI